MIQDLKDNIKQDKLSYVDDKLDKKCYKIEKKIRQSIKQLRSQDNGKLMGFMLTAIMMNANNPLVNNRPDKMVVQRNNKVAYKSSLTPQSILDNLNNKYLDEVTDQIAMESMPKSLPSYDNERNSYHHQGKPRLAPLRNKDSQNLASQEQQQQQQQAQQPLQPLAAVNPFAMLAESLRKKSSRLDNMQEEPDGTPMTRKSSKFVKSGSNRS